MVSSPQRFLIRKLECPCSEDRTLTNASYDQVFKTPKACARSVTGFAINDSDWASQPLHRLSKFTFTNFWHSWRAQVFFLRIHQHAMFYSGDLRRGSLFYRQLIQKHIPAFTNCVFNHWLSLTATDYTTHYCLSFVHRSRLPQTKRRELTHCLHHGLYHGSQLSVRAVLFVQWHVKKLFNFFKTLIVFKLYLRSI